MANLVGKEDCMGMNFIRERGKGGSAGIFACVIGLERRAYGTMQVVQ